MTKQICSSQSELSLWKKMYVEAGVKLSTEVATGAWFNNPSQHKQVHLILSFKIKQKHKRIIKENM